MYLIILWFWFTSQMAILSNINFYLRLQDQTVLYISWQARENIFLHMKVSIYKVILDDIIEQDTSFLDCKHKHMMKCGSPPDKFGVLYHMVTYRVPWFHKQSSMVSQAELILRVITLWFLVLSQFF